MKPTALQGMPAFTVIWAGQVFSLIGSAMTGFAFTIWAWQKTGQATALALVGFFFMAPMVLFSPIAGALVDRWNRKLTMMLSDLATGLTTIVVLGLYLGGRLEIWHLYAVGIFSGFFQAFQWPAYSAAISQMIPKTQFGRASGMLSLAQWGSGIFAPVLAAALIEPIGIAGILIIDLVTLGVAILTLLSVPVPDPGAPLESRRSLWKDSLYGFQYILARRPLLGLQLVFFLGNFFTSLAGTLINPMVLARTGDSTSILSFVRSAGAIGGVAGSLLITAWGGPRRRILGVTLGWILAGLIGYALLGATPYVPVWIAASLVGALFGPIINASNQAIWQSKVPPQLQGRVFSVRLVIATITAPVAMLIAGPLADQVLEPAMRDPGSALAQTFGPIFGTGPGVGMFMIVLAMGLLTMLAGAAGLLNPTVRTVETAIPDFDAVQPGAAPTFPATPDADAVSAAPITSAVLTASAAPTASAGASDSTPAGQA